MLLEIPVSKIKLIVFVVSKTNWSKSFIGIYKAKAVKKVAKKIFATVIKSGILLNPPTFLSKNTNKIKKFKMEAIE